MPSVAPVPVAPASGKAVTVPVLNVTNGPSQVPLKGSARDPFTPQKQAQKPSAKTSTTAAATQPAGAPATKTTASAPTTRGSSPAPAAASGNGGGSGGSSNGGSPSSSSSSTLTAAPPVTMPATPTIPTVSLHAPSALSSTESYTVAVKLTG